MEKEVMYLHEELAKIKKDISELKEFLTHLYQIIEQEQVSL